MKVAMTKPWSLLYTDWIGTYKIKAKDGSAMDFMCFTMIKSATMWFEMEQLQVME